MEELRVTKEVRKIAVSVLVASLLCLAVQATAADITVRPVDSLMAENQRIWVPVEVSGSCRIIVTIFDNDGKKVRKLVDQLMKSGYYNFYWDKIDSSGQFVTEGAYNYTVNGCNLKRKGTLVANYGRWERSCRIEPKLDSSPPSVRLELADDSALVTVDIVYRNGRKVATPVKDSLLNRGVHHLSWKPNKLTPSGKYQFHLTVGDYKQTFEFTYLK